jgi:hypothetical protein
LTQNTNDRISLEQSLIEKSLAVDNSQPAQLWLEDPKLEVFIAEWDRLINYYQHHANDKDIGVEVIREFLDFNRLFRNILLDENESKQTRERATEHLETLEYRLSEIIKEVVTHLENGDTRDDR